MKHSRLLARACSLLSIILLVACGPLPEPPLRIGTNIWPGYEPLYLARNLGFYQGSSIKLVEMNSASAVIHALRSGCAGLRIE